MFGLNPFFIRARFQIKIVDGRGRNWRLNPFFIRARFQITIEHWETIEEPRLNPFFIRARFQIARC